MKCLIFVFAMAAVSASADDGRSMKEACRADAEKLCAGMKPGKGLFRCLKKNESSVSAECKETITEKKQDRKDRHEACKADIEKFCKDTKPGGGRIMQCLKQNEAALSEGCRLAGERSGAGPKAGE